MTTNTKLTDAQIAKLEAAGGKRWQKYGKDRIYFNATSCGLELQYYKSGNISGSILNGEVISHANGALLKETKFFVEVSDGSIHHDCYNRNKAEFIDQIVAYIAALLEDEPETTEETTEETMTETDARAYATKTDVMEQEIIPALDGHEDDYDLDAIFDACWDWRDGAFVQNDADFWAIVQANDISEAC